MRGPTHIFFGPGRMGGMPICPNSESAPVHLSIYSAALKYGSGRGPGICMPHNVSKLLFENGQGCGVSEAPVMGGGE